MRSYGQYCPAAMAMEILGERWAILVIRDLLVGPRRFNDLARGLPGISRTLLTRRLRQLEHVGIVEHRMGGAGQPGEYALTLAGRELQPLVDNLVTWGARWAFGDPDPVHLDPVLLLWWMRNGLRQERLPPHRIVIQFDFRGACATTMWLLVDPADVSVCLQHPGFDVDLLVTADLAALYRVWVGRRTFAQVIRADLVRLDGPPALVRAFPGWWTLSPVAAGVRGALRERDGQARES